MFSPSSSSFSTPLSPRTLSEEKGSGPVALSTLVFSTPVLPEPLRGPRASQPSLCIAAGCPAWLLTSSLLIQLFLEESCSFPLSSSRNLLATQALSSSKLRLDVQQENLNQPLSCTTQQKPARRFHTTSNGTATTPFSTFQGR